jgi:hypothetical protein
LKTGFVTDSFSSLGGLAAVAYGDADYFREVQNQIYRSSVSGFVDTLRPSSTFESFLPSEGYFLNLVLSALEDEYDLDEFFTDYIDVALGPFWRTRVEKDFMRSMYSALDSPSNYGLTLSDYVALSVRSTIFYKVDSVQGVTDKPSSAGFTTVYLNTTDEPPTPQELERRVIDGIVSAVKADALIGRDAEFVIKLASNNPQTKISVPPPDAVIPLEVSVDLGLDYRGTEFVSSYLPPKDYYSNVAYPGFVGSTSLPVNFRDSVIQGYVGYPSGLPLELVFNPVGAESIRNMDMTSPASLLAPTDPFSAGSVLGSLPSLSQSDRDIYDISLIGPTMNGYLSFDPGTMSNGDLLNASLIPQFESDNADKDGGLNPASRNFSTAL